jgi:hypothetical protein
MKRAWTGIPNDVLNQIENAYREMAHKARYRPAAPSDGFGNITVADSSLNLLQEMADYAKQWWTEEDSCNFNIGCCDMSTRPATIFAIEAARQMCSGHLGRPTALRLLHLATEQLKSVMEEERGRTTGRRKAGARA